MKIAVEGCAHGELEKIYDSIEYIEKMENVKVDLLICCGDFQSTRNEDDLQCMNVKPKFQDMCTFYKYYSGEKLAPILTIFIGGNHEASNYLQELPYGGWVAPNIYYLGYAGVININGIRIGGISGIYNSHDFLKGHHELSPYSESTKRSVYHTRQLEVFRLKQLAEPIDVFLSHDWPRGIYHHGDWQQLVKFKPFFRSEIENNQLGSPACEDLLFTLCPQYWFSAHLHCKFSALVNHENGSTTKFLALDKCLPRRRFLQILTLKSNETADDKMKITYDPEWLAILVLTNHLLSVKHTVGYMPGPGDSERWEFTPSEAEKAFVKEKLNDDLSVPNNFKRTVKAFKKDCKESRKNQQPNLQINPQTTAFCDKLVLDDPSKLALLMSGQEVIEGNNLSDDSEEETTINRISEKSVCAEPVTKEFVSLSLPPPKCAPPSNPDELDIDESLDSPQKGLNCDTVDESVSAEKEDSHIDVATDPKVENAVTPETPLKKFKRRNQSIYATENE